MAEELIHQVARTFGLSLLQAYGMTELTTVTVLLPEDHVLEGAAAYVVRRLRSAGRPVAGVDVRVLDDCDHQGRMWRYRLGYWKQLEATKQALRDGWMHTGDMGMLDQDGYLYVVDRKK